MPYFPRGSLFWRESKIQRSEEICMFFKTIEKEVKKLHSYTIPCILEIPIKKGNLDYLKWVKQETLKPNLKY